MKRRSFVLTTGVIGASLSTGLAATSTFFTPSSPWHFVKELDAGFIKPMDSFAKEVRHHLKNHAACEELVKSVVMPKKIISQDLQGGNITYQNAGSSYVSISKRKGEDVVISIYQSLPKAE